MATEPPSRDPRDPLGAIRPGQDDFDPRALDKTVVAIPLLLEMQQHPRKRHPVIIDLNVSHPRGRAEAREHVIALLREVSKLSPRSRKTRRSTDQYVFAALTAAQIVALVQRDRAAARHAEGDERTERERYFGIFRIWPDFKVGTLADRSVATVKADAALRSFSTTGADIVWAVMDTGIDATHPHFVKHDNLNVRSRGLWHRDFSTGAQGDDDVDDARALADPAGHGTHVAGIIAGEMTKAGGKLVAVRQQRDEKGVSVPDSKPMDRITGVAPACKLLSLKVLDDQRQGHVSSIIEAIAHVQALNGYGRHLRVHGVNMSVGYTFEPEWFACGQSPLCVEVNRLVKSGVCVVVAAGNTGYAWHRTAARGTMGAGLGMSINDPGNAELAITVGSTHRDMPHVYGVPYFSSKGPTGDGRPKPDLVAPGEKIVSCRSRWHGADPGQQQALHEALDETLLRWGSKADRMAPDANAEVFYSEDSGTSMAAPHVSGAVAAFLSVRREFIGQPEKVKEIFLASATDLRRERYFQGHGLLDLMRAIQSV